MPQRFPHNRYTKHQHHHDSQSGRHRPHTLTSHVNQAGLSGSSLGYGCIVDDHTGSTTDSHHLQEHTKDEVIMTQLRTIIQSVGQVRAQQDQMSGQNLHTTQVIQEIAREQAEMRSEMQHSQHNIKNALGEIREQVAETNNDVRTNTEDLKDLHRKYQTVQDRLDRIDDELERAESQNRKNNLRIHGVAEADPKLGREDCEKIVKNILEEYMPDKARQDDFLERAFRAGPRYQGQRPRPIIARFYRWADTLRVLGDRTGRDRMKRENLHLSQDLTRRQSSQLRDLRARGIRGYFLRGKLYEREDKPRSEPLRRSNGSPQRPRNNPNTLGRGASTGPRPSHPSYHTDLQDRHHSDRHFPRQGGRDLHWWRGVQMPANQPGGDTYWDERQGRMRRWRTMGEGQKRNNADDLNMGTEPTDEEITSAAQTAQSYNFNSSREELSQAQYMNTMSTSPYALPSRNRPNWVPHGPHNQTDEARRRTPDNDNTTRQDRQGDKGGPKTRGSRDRRHMRHSLIEGDADIQTAEDGVMTNGIHPGTGEQGQNSWPAARVLNWESEDLKSIAEEEEWGHKSTRAPYEKTHAPPSPRTSTSQGLTREEAPTAHLEKKRTNNTNTTANSPVVAATPEDDIQSDSTSNDTHRADAPRDTGTHNATTEESETRKTEQHKPPTPPKYMSPPANNSKSTQQASMPTSIWDTTEEEAVTRTEYTEYTERGDWPECEETTVHRPTGNKTKPTTNRARTEARGGTRVHKYPNTQDSEPDSDAETCKHTLQESTYDDTQNNTSTRGDASPKGEGGGEGQQIPPHTSHPSLGYAGQPNRISPAMTSCNYQHASRRASDRLLSQRKREDSAKTTRHKSQLDASTNNKLKTQSRQTQLSFDGKGLAVDKTTDKPDRQQRAGGEGAGGTGERPGEGNKTSRETSKEKEKEKDKKQLGSESRLRGHMGPKPYKPFKA